MTLEEQIRETLTDLMWEGTDMDNIESTIVGVMKEYIDHIQTLTDIIDQEMLPNIGFMYSLDIDRLNAALIKSRKLLS